MNAGNEERLILRDVFIPGGRVADITITNGYVSHAGSADRGDLEIYCRGRTVIPAGIDMHVHMRDGVQKKKETFETGTKSALAGGVTAVIDQPNTIPPLTTAEWVQERLSLAGNQAHCRFGINGAVTPDSALHDLWKSGVCAFGETFAGPSSYGEAIDATVLKQAMDEIASIKGLMTIHAEQVTEGYDNSLSSHDTLRPALGEAEAVREVLALNTSACRLHFCHLSSKQAIQEVPPEKATIEVTPHHLFLSKEQFEDTDTTGKVNPAIRSESERKALLSCWDRIDIIASDHAPHTLVEKQEPFEKAPSGIPGVETMIPLLMGRYHQGTVSLTDIIKKTSIRPAEILGIRPPGFRPGDVADFAIYQNEITRIEADLLHSKAGWTPYEGMEASFPEQVILGGTLVYESGQFFRTDVITGAYSGTSPLWIPGRGYSHKEHIV